MANPTLDDARSLVHEAVAQGDITIVVEETPIGWRAGYTPTDDEHHITAEQHRAFDLFLDEYQPLFIELKRATEQTGLDKLAHIGEAIADHADALDYEFLATVTDDFLGYDADTLEYAANAGPVVASQTERIARDTESSLTPQDN